MVTPEIPVTIAASPQAAAPAAAQATERHDHGFNFHEFLSAINPLQYLPVIGTIYRTVTGDVIPETLREGGSMLVSGLLGGPLGVITYIVTAFAEKATGIDPEKIAATELGPTPAPAAAVSAKPPVANKPETVAAAPAGLASASPQSALTPHQLAAYGVRSDASGTLKLGDVEGADALNGVELIRLAEAAAAYGANQRPSPGLNPG
ncbi:hypothetical protein [Acidisphaera sp. S103]|uniref:hypothetical protein n=1 Tax=Acidisphaera sp. S103 TaxID=1747223 RepID=UPI00131A9965|nr:hypothetical protein [Acidisphaera sp. S103]